MLQKCLTHNFFKETFTCLHMSIDEYVQDRPRLKLLQEIISDRYSSSPDIVSIDTKLELQKEQLQFKDKRTENRPYLGALTFFSFVQEHEQYDREFFSILEESLDSTFISEDEFNQLYDNLFSFTIRSILSDDVQQDIFPLMKQYLSTLERVHPLQRIEVHTRITNIFKEEGYRGCIEKIGETLSQYKAVNDNLRYQETPGSNESIS